MTSSRVVYGLPVGRAAKPERVTFGGNPAAAVDVREERPSSGERCARTARTRPLTGRSTSNVLRCGPKRWTVPRHRKSLTLLSYAAAVIAVYYW